MVSVEIYIPTLGRVGRSTQISLTEFTSKSIYSPILVCPPTEVLRHRRYCSRVMPCSESGIGPTRQWIIEKSKADVVILVDDDMKFQYRPNKWETKLQQSIDLNPMIQRCLNCIRLGYIHGGVSARQGNNNCLGNHKDNTRNCNFHFLDRRKVLNTNARFDQLPVMEDFHFILTLLTQGYSNRVLFDYSWNQRPGSVGGCNLYRTLDLQSQAAEGLQAAFPDFVTVVTKKSKTGWSIAKGVRKDVRVQWVKAARSGGIDV